MRRLRNSQPSLGHYFHPRRTWEHQSTGKEKEEWRGPCDSKPLTLAHSGKHPRARDEHHRADVSMWTLRRPTGSWETLFIPLLLQDWALISAVSSVSCIKHGLHLGLQGPWKLSYPSCPVSAFTPWIWPLLHDSPKVHTSPKHASGFPYDYITWWCCSHLHLYKIFFDVCTMTKLLNDAFLKTYPHC